MAAFNAMFIFHHFDNHVTDSQFANLTRLNLAPDISPDLTSLAVCYFSVLRLIYSNFQQNGRFCTGCDHNFSHLGCRRYCPADCSAKGAEQRVSFLITYFNISAKSLAVK